MFEPVDVTSKTMDDLVKFLFFELKENNEPISETQMQKLIFKIKMELGKDHELYEELPEFCLLKVFLDEKKYIPKPIINMVIIMIIKV